MNNETTDPDYIFIMSMRSTIRESINGNRIAKEMINKYNALSVSNLTTEEAFVLGYELSKNASSKILTDRIKELLND